MARTWSSLFLSTYKIIENNNSRAAACKIFFCTSGVVVIVGRRRWCGMLFPEGTKAVSLGPGSLFGRALSDREGCPLQYSKHCKALCSFEVLCSVSQVLCVYGNLPCNFPAMGDRLPSIMLGLSVRLCRYRLLRPGFGICCFGFCIPARWLSSFARWPDR